jgi:hypothetical protein
MLQVYNFPQQPPSKKALLEELEEHKRTLKIGPDGLSRNVGKKLPLHAARIP